MLKNAPAGIILAIKVAVTRASGEQKLPKTSIQHAKALGIDKRK